MAEQLTETFEDSGGALGSEPSRELPHLFVVLECDRPMAGGARYCLEDVDVVQIGRGQERTGELADSRTLRVSVPGRSLSAQHARIERRDGGFVLEDLGSTNGSYVNGARVGSQRLADGDFIELGHTLFRVRFALPTPPHARRVYDASERPPHPALATLLPSFAESLLALARVAKSALTVLIVGETGTGKELTANAVHVLSARAGPFVAVNCGALPPNLVESSLFGHVKGAFSGAHRDEPGFLRAAVGGTLLLDEIGDLPPPAQAALLRALEEREVVPVGSSRAVSFDARVVAATHRDLDALVAAGSFRGDLLARLDGYRFELPRLSERREDIGLVVREVLANTPGGASVQLAPEAGYALVSNDWHFNVRELVHEIERAVVISGGDPIRKAHLVAARRRETPGAAERQPTSARELDPVDLRLKQELERRLREHRGNVADVARAMGKARMQIHRWLKRFDIDPGVFRLRRRDPGDS